MKTFIEIKKDGILKEHNIPTYQRIQELFERGEKHVGVVQATGTGKSYLAMQWLFDNIFSKPNQHALVLDPLKGIVKQFNELSDKIAREKGLSPYDMPIVYARYDQLKTLSDEEIRLLDFDYIVLDEFHGLGAEGRGTVTQKLLEANPNAKVLGLTATPIRYLDKQRDMGDELFGDNIVRGINLREAIEQGILPEPDYVMAVYSYADTISTIEEKIKKVKDKTQRELFEKELTKAKQRAETAEGLSDLFARKIKNKNGKFIAFCSDTERMDSLAEEIKNGLMFGVNKKIKLYRISFKDVNEKSNKIIKEFEDDESDSLKIMLAVNMFNEGIHVKDIDGCFMFRPTISPRIYTQQLGRVLNARDDSNFHPVVFDVVNNIQCLDKIIQAFADDDKRNGVDFIAGDDYDALPFKIDGNDVELNSLLARLDAVVSEQTVSIEQWLSAAERYKNQYGNLDIPNGFIEEETELRLGGWLFRVKNKFNQNPKLVNPIIIETLLKLDTKVFSYTYENYVMERDETTLQLLKQFVKEFGKIPVPSVRKMDLDEKYLPLAKQCGIIKQFLKGRGTSKYSEEFISEILKINPNALNDQQKVNEDRDQKTLDLLKMFTKEFGRIPVPGERKADLDEKYIPLSKQCAIIKQFLKGKGTSKYSEEFISEILEINPNALKEKSEIARDKNNEILSLLKEFVEEFGQVPVPSTQSRTLPSKYKLLASHFVRVKKYLAGDNGITQYDEKFISEILEINPNALKTKDELKAERDEKTIEQLKMFVEEFGQIPIPGRSRSGNGGKYEHLILQCYLIKEHMKGRGTCNFNKELIEEILQINPNAFGSEFQNSQQIKQLGEEE